MGVNRPQRPQPYGMPSAPRRRGPASCPPPRHPPPCHAVAAAARATVIIWKIIPFLAR